MKRLGAEDFIRRITESPWGPPGLLYYGFQTIVPEVNPPGAWCRPSTSIYVRIPLLTLWAFRTFSRVNFTLLTKASVCNSNSFNN
jgi:hypothetical protein